MLAILFPHLFEDTEFLVPESDEMDGITFFANDEAVYDENMLDHDTPVAGPSRLA